MRLIPAAARGVRPARAVTRLAAARGQLAEGVRGSQSARVSGRRVDVSLYSVGEHDVSAIAAEFGGGGHRNAAGFSVPLGRWLKHFA